MAVNRNWVKTDGVALTYAPTWLVTDDGLVVNPTDEQYRAAGWMKNEITPPDPREGMIAAGTRYEARDGRVTAVYEYVDAPKVPRTFSKLYLILALQRRGLYEQFKEMVFAAELGDLWLAANELNEGFEGMPKYIEMAKAVLGLTDAQVEEILAEAVAR